MADSPSAAPSEAASTRADPLDGEVLPPRLRVVNPEPAAPGTADEARPRFPFGPVLMAAAVAASLGGTATLEGYRWYLARARAAAAGPSPMALAVARLGRELSDLKAAAARPDPAVEAVKQSIADLRTELDGIRMADASALTQMAARLDARPVVNASALADVVARLDTIDRDPRLGAIEARLGRMEHEVASATPTGSITQQVRPAEEASVVPQSPATTRPAKPPVLDTWVLRDVYAGIALVEGRSGVREVVPGETLPGAGQVQSIQRRGRGWVVITNRGIIDAAAW